MRVVGKRIDEEVKIIEIEKDLSNLQEFVGGFIETPFISEALGNVGIVTILNEEGRLNGMKPTFALVKDGQVVSYLVGQILFCGVKDSDYSDLNEEQIDFLMGRIVPNGAITKDGLKVDVLFI